MLSFVILKTCLHSKKCILVSYCVTCYGYMLLCYFVTVLLWYWLLRYLLLCYSVTCYCVNCYSVTVLVLESRKWQVSQFTGWLPIFFYNLKVFKVLFRHISSFFPRSVATFQGFWVIVINVNRVLTWVLETGNTPLKGFIPLISCIGIEPKSFRYNNIKRFFPKH